MDWFNGVFLIGVAASFVQATYQWWWEPRQQARRKLRRERNVSIRQVKEGEPAKITGVVSAIGSLMRSPIGEHDCVGYRLVVEEIDEDGSRTVLERQACGAFEIMDGTGTAYAEGPFLMGLDADGGWAPVGDGFLAFLADAGVPTEGVFGRHPKFRYQEALLKPGDRVCVMGWASIELDPEGGGVGTRSSPVIARIWGFDAEPVVIADADAEVSA